jgi:hypothetical protein
MNVVADGSMFAGSNTLLVFLPFILVGAGLFFIIRAASDKVDRRDDDTVKLPTKAQYPLYHVHMQIRSASKAPAEAKDANEERASSKPRGPSSSGRSGLKIADGG